MNQDRNDDPRICKIFSGNMVGIVIGRQGIREKIETEILQQVVDESSTTFLQSYMESYCFRQTSKKDCSSVRSKLGIWSDQE